MGVAALNIRFLRKAGVSAADAVSSVGVSQVVAFVAHAVILLTFAALAGTSGRGSLLPPTWVWIALAAAAACLLISAVVPAGREFLRSWLVPVLRRVIPRLLDIAQRPLKLAEGIGGALLVTSAYIGCFDACVRALGGSVALAAVAVVYLTSSAIASAVPTPRGLGTVEAALSAGLAAAGMAGPKPVSAALLFRLVTFWLPVPVGWVAMHYLQRKDAI